MGTVKIIAAALIVVLFLLIHVLNPQFFPFILRMLGRGDILETAEYIRSFGSWAVFFSFWLTLFVNALGFPPAIIFSTANTLIFGILPGIFLSCVAETVGVTVSFLLLRFFFHDTAQKLIAKSKFLTNIDHYSGEKGFIVMLIARMVPYFPSGLLNAVGAVSSMSLRDYALASFIGKFPSTGIEAIIGHDAITMQEDHTRLIAVIIFALILIGWAAWYQKKQLSR
ncbi:MAG: TVP38/TMEM64 family protein [Selenomonadaceae bacterium]|nr:TVP38/TMEM64 family protein [Selenomonadaceae bacterium]